MRISPSACPSKRKPIAPDDIWTCGRARFAVLPPRDETGRCITCTRDFAPLFPNSFPVGRVSSDLGSRPSGGDNDTTVRHKGLFRKGTEDRVSSRLKRVRSGARLARRPRTTKNKGETAARRRQLVSRRRRSASRLCCRRWLLFYDREIRESVENVHTPSPNENNGSTNYLSFGNRFQ